MEFLKDVKAIAIDGPAGSGKSTVSRLVADRLGYLYVDTGAMYRALTLKVMKRNIGFDKEKEIVELSKDLDIKLMPPAGEKNTVQVLLDGENVSEEIRKMEVTVNVKHVAKLSSVRKNLVKLQRQMVSEANGAVMEGRDIGTAVLPDAKHKFYLDASFNERVERRLAELRAKGHLVTRQEISEDVKQRDHTDKTRLAGPLRKAEDAVFIDTTDLTIDDVVKKIIQHVKE